MNLNNPLLLQLIELLNQIELNQQTKLDPDKLKCYNRYHEDIKKELIIKKQKSVEEELILFILNNKLYETEELEVMLMDNLSLILVILKMELNLVINHINYCNVLYLLCYIKNEKNEKIFKKKIITYLIDLLLQKSNNPYQRQFGIITLMFMYQCNSSFLKEYVDDEFIIQLKKIYKQEEGLIELKQLIIDFGRMSEYIEFYTDSIGMKVIDYLDVLNKLIINNNNSLFLTNDIKKFIEKINEDQYKNRIYEWIIFMMKLKLIEFPGLYENTWFQLKTMMKSTELKSININEEYIQPFQSIYSHFLYWLEQCEEWNFNEKQKFINDKLLNLNQKSIIIPKNRFLKDKDNIELAAFLLPVDLGIRFFLCYIDGLIELYNENDKEIRNLLLESIKKIIILEKRYNELLILCITSIKSKDKSNKFYIDYNAMKKNIENNQKEPAFTIEK